MHQVAVVAFDGVIGFDLATAVETFGFTRRADGTPAYGVRVCAPTPEVSAGAFGLRAPHGLDALAGADTVVVPGVRDVHAPVDPAVLAALRTLPPGTRVASICTGAFLLAAAGLLDGRRATTHWAAAATLAARYPSVDVDPDVLYVDTGSVLTSAGAAAGLDLCLHVIRRDHGAALAAAAARAAVMPLERAGGQAQFIVHEPPAPAGATLAPLLEWMGRHAHESHRLADLAARAHLSPRTLSRRFREQTGTTPLQWLHRTRLRRAQHLLETTDEPVERIADHVGYGSPVAFRERFRSVVGTSPQAYRRAFRAGAAADAAGTPDEPAAGRAAAGLASAAG